MLPQLWAVFLSNSYDDSPSLMWSDADPSPGDPALRSMPQVFQSIYTKYRQREARVLHRLPGRGSPWTKEGAAIKKLTDEAYFAGWRSHQIEVANDPKLLAWVRHMDYLNADIWKEMA
jgi:hypothetical protein